MRKGGFNSVQISIEQSVMVADIVYVFIAWVCGS